MSVRKLFIDLTDPVVFQSFGGEAFWKKMEVGPGAVILREGEESRDFYYLFSGRVAVEKSLQDARNTQKVLATLDEGDFFGEGALLSDKMRAATVRALTPCILLQLSQAHFERLVVQDPSSAMGIVLGIVKTLNARLQATNEELVAVHQLCRAVRSAKGDFDRVFAERLSQVEAQLHHPELLCLSSNGALRWKGSAVTEGAVQDFQHGLKAMANVFDVLGGNSYEESAHLWVSMRALDGTCLAVLCASVCDSCRDSTRETLLDLARELGCLLE